MNKKILILHTGGTFGMALGKDSNAQGQSDFYLEQLLTVVPELSSLAHVKLEVLCNIDSSDATPEHWVLIAQTIFKKYQEYEGFVVIHGTDTLAYTSTALAFFFSNLSKPIVLTGSQRPLGALRNDARGNIIDSVELATYDLPEVMVCFDSVVHFAARVTKSSNEHLRAFKSHNMYPIANIGVNFKINESVLQNVQNKLKSSPVSINTECNSNIACLVCLPGVLPTKSYVDLLLSTVDGLVIQGFGSGNLPILKSNWLELFERAQKKNIPIVITTQCESGSVTLEMYENGRTFSSLGAISALDMTIEAACIKMMIMLGRKIPPHKRVEFFKTPLAHECSLSDSYYY